MITELNKQLLDHYGRFPLFGIILFTEAHPHVVMMLKDRDYYAALDEITGEQIAVFATMLFRGEYTYPSPPPGVLAHMVPIWKEPAENKKVLTWFDIRDSRALPLFVVFTVDGDELYYQLYPLKSESPQEVFNSFREVLSAIGVRLQQSKNMTPIDVFKMAKWEIKKLRAKQKVRDILETISVFRGVAGI